MKDTIRVGILLGFSRRLGPNSRPPPEYNDPSGADAFCVPGYLFPCPDAQMMLRSVLFLGGASKAVLRCIPPDIDVELQPGTTSVNRVHTHKYEAQVSNTQTSSALHRLG